MSLSWNVSKVKNYQETCFIDNGDGTQDLRGVTHALIWAGLELGFSQISNKNWKEVAYRVAYAQDMFGAYLRGEGGSYIKVTARDVYNHIGMFTNCPSKTRLQFIKNMAERYERGINIQLEELEGENQVLRENGAA